MGAGAGLGDGAQRRNPGREIGVRLVTRRFQVSAPAAAPKVMTPNALPGRSPAGASPGRPPALDESLTRVIMRSQDHVVEPAIAES